MKIDKATYSRNIQTIGIHETIFREGDQGKYMYVILEGEVEIRKRMDDKLNRTLIILQKGDIFGEMALVDDKARTASAIAVSNCKLLRIDEKTFDIMIRQNSDFAVKMINTLSSRLRNTDSLLEELLCQNIDKQVLMGLRQFLMNKKNLFAKSDISFNGMAFSRWVAQHHGISEKMAIISLENLLNRSIIHKQQGHSGSHFYMISKNILSRIPT